jgi:putative membrane protein
VGSLVNNSRNLALKLHAILKDDRDKAFFRKMIPSYASILNKHLKTKKQAPLEEIRFQKINIHIDLIK